MGSSGYGLGDNGDIGAMGQGDGGIWGRGTRGCGDGDVAQGDMELETWGGDRGVWEYGMWGHEDVEMGDVGHGNMGQGDAGAEPSHDNWHRVPGGRAGLRLGPPLSLQALPRLCPAG